jgi:hypothetical protein
MSSTPNCPCEPCASPTVIANPSGLSTLQYRVGDFTSFRDVMLRSLPGELELVNWKPTAMGDLALQMIEWWAYLADILTFYNQRIANQDYLRTADLDASVNNLIQLLGYRPRPGIGATATLAALVSSPQPITLPSGLAVQSKPGPGQMPQIFELSSQSQVQPGGSISTDPDNSLAQLGADGSVLIAGTVTSIKTGDLLLLVENDWSGGDTHYVVANVQSVQAQLSPRGVNNTRVVFDISPLPVPSGATAAGYRLLRSTQTARLFQYGVKVSVSLVQNSNGSGTADLDSTARQIQPGSLILFDIDGGQTPVPVAGPTPPPPPFDATLSTASWGLSSVLQSIGLGFDQSVLASLGAGESAALSPALQLDAGAPQFQPSQAPLAAHDYRITDDIATKAPSPTVGGSGAVAVNQIPFKSFQNEANSATQAASTPPFQLAIVNEYTEVIWYADNASDPTKRPAPPGGIAVLHSELTFTPLVVAPTNPGSLVIRYGWQEVGVLIAPPLESFAGPGVLDAVTPPGFTAGTQQVLLEDQDGDGDSATGLVTTTDQSQMQFTTALDTPLEAPINVLTNLLLFTRGKTVSNEVLGSGDTTVAGQEFTLAKSPLTYLLSGASTSGSNYSSTLKVWVNSVQWTEQQSFYGQSPTATIFVTYEDQNQVTHVQFGDGVNGARLPSGTGNVIASYRYGSGFEAPDAGTLTVITTPQPGLAAIHNPVAVSGGADPEPSSQIRTYAPLSVLAFDRAISGDDYEAIAASTPGVARASAVWSFDPLQQRPVVTVYVGDDPGAKKAARLALSQDADPNRPINVQLAQPVTLTISLTVEVDPAYVLTTVQAAVNTVLMDPDVGLFGSNRIGIGEVIYRSQIFAACLSVKGAVAVHNLCVMGAPGGAGYRYDPGEGFYLYVDPLPGPTISTEFSSD